MNNNYDYFDYQNISSVWQLFKIHPLSVRLSDSMINLDLSIINIYQQLVFINGIGVLWIRVNLFISYHKDNHFL